MKKILFILIFSVANLCSQITVPLKKTPGSLFTHSFYNENKVELIYSENSPINGNWLLKKINVDPSENTFETVSIFDNDFYKKNGDKVFDGVTYLDEYVINSVNENLYGEKKKVFFIFNLKTNEFSQFDVPVDKNRNIQFYVVVKNKVENSDEITVFAKQNLDLIAKTDKNNLIKYTFTHFNINTKQTTNTFFEASEEELSVCEIIDIKVPNRCVIKCKTIGLKLLNTQTMEIIPIPVQSEYKYVYEHYITKVNGGVILNVLIGNEVMGIEGHRFGISFEHGTAIFLSKETIDPVDPYEWYYLKQTENFKINNETYVCFFRKKKVIVAQIGLSGIKQTEIDISQNMYSVYTMLTGIKNKDVSYYSNKMNSNKGFLTVNIDENSVTETFVDKSYDSDFFTIPYIKKGNTEFLYAKWIKEGVHLSFSIPQ